MTRRNPIVTRETNAAFAEQILSIPGEPEVRRMKVWRNRTFRHGDRALRLTLKRRPFLTGDGTSYVWYVRDGATLVAAGVAGVYGARPDVFQMGSSAVVADRRGQGLYTAVLRALRAVVGTPIESDGTVSAAALAAWRKAGGRETTRGTWDVMRLENPIRPDAPVRESWVDDLLRTPALPQWHRARAWRTATLPAGRLVVKRGQPLATGERWVLWYVEKAGKVVAAGTAVDDPSHDALRLGASAVDRWHRREGVYQGVLRALRKLVGKPIESDVSLTEGAIGAWRKVGGVEARRGPFDVLRINPRAEAPRHRVHVFLHGTPEAVAQVDAVDGHATHQRQRIAHGVRIEVTPRRRGYAFSVIPSVWYIDGTHANWTDAEWALYPSRWPRMRGIVQADGDTMVEWYDTTVPITPALGRQLDALVQAGVAALATQPTGRIPRPHAVPRTLNPRRRR